MLNMGFIEDIETIFERHARRADRAVLGNHVHIAPQDLQHLPHRSADRRRFRQGKLPISSRPTSALPAGQEKGRAQSSDACQRQRSVVFCNTKSMVDELAEMLRKQGFKASGIHGDRRRRPVCRSCKDSAMAAYTP